MAEKSLAVINQYPKDKYNVLVPVETMQEISDFHKVVMNVVTIDPEPAKKDVYPQKNGELSPTKVALSKFMAAANIQLLDSRTVLPQKCQRCAEVAARAKTALRCGDCASADDVAHQVTVAIPEPSGTWRIVKATKEIRMADEQEKMTAAQFKQFFPYRSEHCETKALNRALRQALMLKPSYTKEELQKPFVMAYVVPNMDNPEVRKLAAQNVLKNASDLYGTRAALTEGNAGEYGENVTVIEHEDEPENGQVINGEGHDQEPAANIPPWESEDTGQQTIPDNAMVCRECGQLVEGTNKGTPEAIAEYSQNRFGKILCIKCQREAVAKAKAKGGGGR